ncbi:hypothetical protein UT300012_24110 [Paraclostridium bifermentans]
MLLGKLKPGGSSNPTERKKRRISLFLVAMVLSMSLLVLLPVVQIVSEDFFNYDLLKVKDIKQTEQEGKALYRLDQPEPFADMTGGMSGTIDLSEYIAMGFSPEEAVIVMALDKVLGGYSEASLKSYLGDIGPDYKYTTIYKMLPGVLGEHIKYGISAGIVVSQSAAEQGWYYSEPSRRSSSWKYNNPFGIKGSKNMTTNEYWTGEIEVSATSEGFGSNTVHIKDGFRAYKSVWHACMDHGKLLGNERYGPYNFHGEKDPYKYGWNLGMAGYYTDSKSAYANKMKGVYNGINGKKIDELAELVKEEIMRTEGVQITPDGDILFNDEFKPGNTGGGNGFGPPLENLERFRVSSWYGYRGNIGVAGATSNHQAIDLACPSGTQVLAAKAGVVTQARWSTGYGYMITIQHQDGLFTRYAHNSKLLVKKGDKVSKGDPISLSGNTGVGSGPHLHFEIRTADNYGMEGTVDPLLYFDKYQTGSDWHIKPKASSGTSDGGGANASVKPSSSMPKIQQKFITNKSNYKSGGNRNIDYIVMHETLNFGKGNGAKMHQEYFQSNKRGVSAHYVVDDKNVINVVNDKDIAYHAGRNIRKGDDPRRNISNNNSIGIELCVNEDSDWRKTRENGVHLVAYLLVKYGLTPDKVYNHHDVSGKEHCPEVMMNKHPEQWPAFKKAVEKEYNKLKKQSQAGHSSSHVEGKEVKAEYTAYYPANNAMEGGFHDQKGKLLNPDEAVVAGPKSLSYGTKVLIKETNSKFDNKVHTKKDNGGAIVIKGDGTYRFDILTHNSKEANSFGRRKGKAVIGVEKSGSGSRPPLASFDKDQYLSDINKILKEEFNVLYDTKTLSDDRVKLIHEISKHQTRVDGSKKYVMGGNGPSNFDCSGLQKYVYSHALGVNLPRTSSQQRASEMMTKRASVDDAVPGDIMGRDGHVAMFMGKVSSGRMLIMDAYSTGKPIEFRVVNTNWASEFFYPSEISSK